MNTPFARNKTKQQQQIRRKCTILLYSISIINENNGNIVNSLLWYEKNLTFFLCIHTEFQHGQYWREGGTLKPAKLRLFHLFFQTW